MHRSSHLNMKVVMLVSSATPELKVSEHRAINLLVRFTELYKQLYS